MADFCHPTDKGYQIWGEALAPLLASATATPAQAAHTTPTPEKTVLWPEQAPIGDGKFEKANTAITVYRQPNQMALRP
jgi:hypothetical protein